MSDFSCEKSSLSKTPKDYEAANREDTPIAACENVCESWRWS